MARELQIRITGESSHFRQEAAQVVREDQAVGRLQVADLATHLVRVDLRPQHIRRAVVQRLQFQVPDGDVRRHAAVAREVGAALKVGIEQPLHVGVVAAGKEKRRPPERRSATRKC